MANEYHGFEVAVIGMSGRFPGAENIDKYWENLCAGEESISFFTEEELRDSKIDASNLQDANYVKAKGYLPKTEYFDAKFFGYSPKEARTMDPQIRLFHECVWETLEDAGYIPEKYNGLIGLYAGGVNSTPWQMGLFASSEFNEIDTFNTELLSNKDFLTTRISYNLGLKGPSYSLNTQCSTSLVAIHVACQALLAGECDIALAGGISLLFPAKSGFLHVPGMVVSEDGHCRTFDANSSGTIWGDGVGVVALKRLELAQRDNDNILAVIKGSAVNNDGARKAEFTAPSASGQAEVISAALRMAEVDPETIQYVEAHGTGTKLGDPIEIEGLKRAFGTNNKGFCAIGSVKSNLGHLIHASGVASFIKTVLSLNHKKMVPSLNFSVPNPKIDFENSPFYVNTSLTDWPKNNDLKRRAGVSSFGIGGTNAHIILEESPQLEKNDCDDHNQVLFSISAKCQESLDGVVEKLVDHLGKNPNINLGDLGYTLHRGREDFDIRSSFTCSDKEQLLEMLRDSALIKSSSNHLDGIEKSVTFMFPGQGSQYFKMGRQTYLKEPFFAQIVDEGLAYLKEAFGIDLGPYFDPSPTFNTPDNLPDVDNTNITQPLVFIIEYALARLLISWGINPDAMIGHSIGEYVAASIAGVIDYKDALKLVTKRGQLMFNLESGAMLAVGLNQDKLIELLPDNLSLSVINSEDSCVVGGTNEAVNSFSEYLNQQGVRNQLLKTSHAFHSHLMEPMLEDFGQVLKTIEFSEPVKKYISNVSGTWVNAKEAIDPEYWIKHVRATVNFDKGLKTLLKEDASIFLEVGPGIVLTGIANKLIRQNENHVAINVLPHPSKSGEERKIMLEAIGKIWRHGKPIDWEAFYAYGNYRRISLPTYSFQQEDFSVKNHNVQKQPVNDITLNETIHSVSDWFYVPGWKRTNHFLTTPNQKFNWLIFKDTTGFWKHVEEALIPFGNVVLVGKGKVFEKTDDTNYTIDPAEKNQYIALFKQLIGLKLIPNKIIDLNNLSLINDGFLSVSKLQNGLENSFFNPINLINAISDAEINQEVQLFFVANKTNRITGTDEIQPEKTFTQSLASVVSQEFPFIKCSSIDIGLSTYEQENESIAKTLALCCTQSKIEHQFAIRHPYVWAPTYEPIRLPKNQGPHSRLKDNGVYFITGGIGEIGLTIAEYLAEYFKAKLVLTGKSTYPSPENYIQFIEDSTSSPEMVAKVKKLLRLKELGGEILVLKADVTEELEMKEAVKLAEEKFGKINGFVHAAGVVNENTMCQIENLTRDRFEKCASPKVEGLLVLDKLPQVANADFCILFSSIASILGGLGHASYAAANRFMDMFVEYKLAKEVNHWISVDWGEWQGKIKNFKEESNTEVGIDQEKGKEAFSKLFETVFSGRIVISSDNLLKRIDDWVKPHSVDMENTKVDVATFKENFVINSSKDVERILFNLFKKVLGHDEFSETDNFFELGASSLDLIGINREIKRIFNKSLSVDLLFSYPTIESLSVYLYPKESNPGAAVDRPAKAKRSGKGKLLSRKSKINRNK